MNERDSTRKGVNNGRTEGNMSQTAGRLKEGARDSLADDKLERSGQADQGEGKHPKTLGIAKDKAPDSESANG